MLGGAVLTAAITGTETYLYIIYMIIVYSDGFIECF